MNDKIGKSIEPFPHHTYTEQLQVSVLHGYSTISFGSSYVYRYVVYVYIYLKIPRYINICYE